MQALLTNARKASAVSSNSSSGSSGTLSTDEDASQLATPNPAACLTPDIKEAGATADAPEAAAAGGEATADENKAEAGKCTATAHSSQATAHGHIASIAEHRHTADQTKFLAADEHIDGQENFVWGLLRDCYTTVKAQLPKQLQKLLQPALWIQLTQAANKCTGQGIVVQPWWQLDSWLTAPAEVQYQRYLPTPSVFTKLYHMKNAVSRTLR